MNIVWTYWEDRPGVPTPPHILLCREVLRYQCKECEIRLVTPSNVHQYLPDLDPRVWRISLQSEDQNPIAIRCDFIRAFLLERFGGLYVDADCITLKDFAEAFRVSAGYEFFAMRRTSAKTQHISIGFYGAKAKGKVISAYAEKLRQILKEKTHFKWAEAGAHLLSPIVDGHPDSVFLFREDQIQPIVAENQELLAATDKETVGLIPGDALCLMLFHRIFGEGVNGVTLAYASAQDLYRGDWLVSRVLRSVYPQIEFERGFGSKRSTSIMNPTTEKSPYIATRYDIEKLIERIRYWVPPGEFESQETTLPKSNLKIAAVVEERLYQGLRYEAHMMLLTPNNWKNIIEYGKPDLLLMESVWNTATGHWHMSQCQSGPSQAELLGMISAARNKRIPTVFWLTKGHVYHPHYVEFSRNFDFVYSADAEEVTRLRQAGIEAELLPPCVQPAVYYPPATDGKFSERSTSVLFDGWADLDKLADELAELRRLKSIGLRIIESRYQIFNNRKNVLPEFINHIKGCVTPNQRAVLLRSACVYLTFDRSLSTPTTHQWMCMEAAASGLPIVHCGRLARDDIREGIVIQVMDQEALVAAIVRLVEDGAYFSEQAAKCLSQVSNQHTFTHRLRDLAVGAGVDL